MLLPFVLERFHLPKLHKVRNLAANTNIFLSKELMISPLFQQGNNPVKYGFLTLGFDLYVANMHADLSINFSMDLVNCGRFNLRFLHFIKFL